MEEEIRQSWWKRNWKWALPSGGCLTILIIIAVIIITSIRTLSKSTSIMEFINVVTELQSNVEVAEALGKPIEIRDETYDPEASPDHLDLEMQLEGQKADGTLVVKADKIDGKWVYTVFTITVKGTDQVLDLTKSLNN